jgi:hypothetical protein
VAGSQLVPDAQAGAAACAQPGTQIGNVHTLMGGLQSVSVKQMSAPPHLPVNGLQSPLGHTKAPGSAEKQPGTHWLFSQIVSSGVH